MEVLPIKSQSLDLSQRSIFNGVEAQVSRSILFREIGVACRSRIQDLHRVLRALNFGAKAMVLVTVHDGINSVRFMNESTNGIHIR